MEIDTDAMNGGDQGKGNALSRSLNGEKISNPHVCSLRGNRCKLRQSLVRHSMIHNADNPNVCPCGKEYCCLTDLKKRQSGCCSPTQTVNVTNSSDCKNNQSECLSDANSEYTIKVEENLMQPVHSEFTSVNVQMSDESEKHKRSDPEGEKCDGTKTPALLPKKNYVTPGRQKPFSNKVGRGTELRSDFKKRKYSYSENYSYESLIGGSTFPSELGGHKRMHCMKLISTQPRSCNQVDFDINGSESKYSQSIEFDCDITKLRDCYVLLERLPKHVLHGNHADIPLQTGCSENMSLTKIKQQEAGRSSLDMLHEFESLKSSHAGKDVDSDEMLYVCESIVLENSVIIDVEVDVSFLTDSVAETADLLSESNENEDILTEDDNPESNESLGDGVSFKIHDRGLLSDDVAHKVLQEENNLHNFMNCDNSFVGGMTGKDANPSTDATSLTYIQEGRTPVGEVFHESEAAFPKSLEDSQEWIEMQKRDVSVDPQLTKEVSEEEHHNKKLASHLQQEFLSLQTEAPKDVNDNVESLPLLDAILGTFWKILFEKEEYVETSVLDSADSDIQYDSDSLNGSISGSNFPVEGENLDSDDIVFIGDSIVSKNSVIENSMPKILAREVTSKPYVCSVCGHQYKFRSSLNRHMNLHKADNPNVCSCGKLFSHLNQLRRHQRENCKLYQVLDIANSSDSKNSQSKGFSDASSEGNIRVQENPLHLVNSVCTSEAVEMSDESENCLRSDPEVKKFNETKKSVSLPERNYINPRIPKPSLKSIIEEEASKPHVCSECGNRYKTESSLIRHSMIHRPDNPNVCSCGKRFCCISDLKSHWKVSCRLNHMRDGKNSSDSKNRFSDASSENDVIPRTQKPSSKSLNIGKTSTPYVCSECGNQYMSKQSLNRHSTIHKDDNPNVCSCGKIFCCLSDLKTHWRRGNCKINKPLTQ